MKLSVIVENVVAETKIGHHDQTLPFDNDSHLSSSSHNDDRDWFITGDDDDDTDVDRTIRQHEQDIGVLKRSTQVGFRNVNKVLKEILSRLDGLESKLK